ncbi:hypothetical protein H2200_010830 [Cladophialophora chaetospira]|uniref:Uncharacterized protein n=1 Tax=Cladophialophora chaetospira TaxID=386627 RepID=A0AA39CDW6_9EURO|nr:hypothetical protein H2200_010830 [Cladophialophora chaetospira]
MFANLFFGTQGVLLVLNGIYLLLFPEKAATDAWSPLFGTPIPVVRAMSVSSFTIGGFYLLAVYRRDRVFMALSTPGRFLAFAVFWILNGGPWRNVAMFEEVMGLLTGLILLL